MTSIKIKYFIQRHITRAAETPSLTHQKMHIVSQLTFKECHHSNFVRNSDAVRISVGLEYQAIINEETADSMFESVSNGGSEVMKHCQVLT
jgi:hypothetical protein